MSFDDHTFSKVSPKHMERVQHIIVVMGCYINSTGVRLHDVYKLNTNTERKVTITHLVVCPFCIKKPTLKSFLFFVAVEHSWNTVKTAPFTNIKSPDNLNTL